MTCGGDSQEEQKMNMIYSWWLICKVSLLYDFRMGCDPPWYEDGGGGHTPFWNHSGEIESLAQVCVSHSNLILGCDPLSS